MSHLRISVALLVMLSCALIAADRLWNQAMAITCVNPNATNQGDAWPAAGSISVNISNFPTNLQPCVKTALDNWNTANANSGNLGNGTNVKFTSPTFNNTQVATGPTGGTNVFQITYEQTTNQDGSVNNGVAGTTVDQPNASGTALKNAKSQINPNVTDCTQVTQVTAHEIGHTLGLGECPNCQQPQQSVMINIPCRVWSDQTHTLCLFPDWNNTTNGLPAPTTCDNSTINKVYFPPPPPPPHCTRILTCSDGEAWNSIDCACEPSSPIIIDVGGNGFNLTNAATGVMFDISGTDHPVQMGWTSAGADNAFLALPGSDGLVHNGQQLFGNFTPQPPSATPNGFAALAVYDDPKNGGNGDGVIDSRDAIFASLRLWVDANHDGVSQPEELHTLPSLGVNSISLTYKADQRTDQWGNAFHYRAQVNPSGATSTGRMAYDVFFVVAPNPAAKNTLNPEGGKCQAPATKVGLLATAR